MTNNRTVTVPRPFAPESLLKSLFSQISLRFLGMAMGLFVTAWVARYLGPLTYGKLNYSLALIAVAGSTRGLGIKTALASLLSNPSQHRTLLHSAFTLELLSSLLHALILLLIAFSSSDNLIFFFIVCGAVALIFDSSEVYESFLFHQERGSLVAKSIFFQTSAFSASSLIGLTLCFPSFYFGFPEILQRATKFFFLRRITSILNPQVVGISLHFSSCKVLLRKGLPFMISALGVVVYMKSDILMLEWLTSSFDVGQYSTAVRITETLYFLPLVLSQTLMPRILNSTSLLPDQILSNTKQLYRQSWILGFLMTAITLFVFPPLSSLILGSQYSSVGLILIYLAPASFAVSLGTASSFWLNANGYGRVAAQRSFLGAISNLALNYFLIPTYGPVGAAIATSVSYIISVLVIGLLDQRLRNNTLLLIFPL